MNKPKVIITIPAFNEANTIGSVLHDIKGVMDKTSYNYKILVVDDGSKDETAQLAREAGASVFSNKCNRGLAETFRVEMQKCLELKADIIVHTDADGQYVAEGIPLLLGKLVEGYDLVMGSRFAGKIEHMPFIKYWGNKAFSRVLSKIIKCKITDSQTGFRAFTKEVAAMEIISNHTYTQEQIIRASKLGLRIAEVPILARKTRASRLIKNPFEYAFKAWINILRVYRDYEPLKFFGKMALLFFIPGLIIGIFLVINFIRTGKVGHYPSVVLSVLLILIGLQIGLFGFLADINRK